MGYWPSFLRLQKLKMTKKILLIIGILIVIGIAVFMIFFSAPATETGESRVGFSIRDYLPFGNSDNTSNNASTTDQNNNGNQDDNIVTTLSNQPIQAPSCFGRFIKRRCDYARASRRRYGK